MTIGQKIKSILRNISVEPMLFLLMVPSMMNNLTTVNLNLEKACRVNLEYNSSVCDAMTSRQGEGYEKSQEQEVQKLVANMATIKMIIIGSYPVLLVLFLGSWSDRHRRRKPLIIMPIIGDLVGTICLFFCAYFFLELPIEWSMIAETVPFALCGTWTCEFLGLYTYVSGISKEEDRTIRIGSVSVCQFISMTLGMMMSGIAIKTLGFKGVYLLSASLLTLSLIFGMLMVHDSLLIGVKENVQCKNSICEFFSLKHVKNTMKTCFKKGENQRRKKMMFLMILTLMIMGPLHAEYNIFYLYTRLKYGWNEVDFSMYAFVHSIIQITGGMFALSFFSKYLKFDDSVLGMIATISKISASIIYAFAPTGFYFYLGNFVEIFENTGHIAMRSIMAKLVPAHELGQSNSIFAIFESVTPLLFGPIYTKLYNKTIGIFPGAFLILTATLYSCTLYIFLWMYRNRNSKDESSKQYDIVNKGEEVPIA